MTGLAGAGRIAHALTQLGFQLDAVRQAVIAADLPAPDLDAIDLGRRFAVVVLGSHLVNLPDERARRAFLRVAVRHLRSGGTVLVEHHPLDWAETVAEVRATPGGSNPGMVDVRKDPPFVSAVSVYDVGGRLVRQPFTARVLSEPELTTELDAAGLRVRRRLAPTWLEAEPLPDSA